ncbi:DUF6262 family protein [Kiloniella sp.]|uniref:DUF6262 family protein n=1 Tax=Kiloniella sp. TaxID=1938587 RepID=UPI003A936FF3
MAKSGKQAGEENVEKLRHYLNAIDAVPERSGKANISAIAEACGFQRQVLYKNPAAKELLEKAIAEKGLKGISKGEEGKDQERLLLDSKINRLEQSNAALNAEVFELRRKLEQYSHIEEMLERGKRVDL